MKPITVTYSTIGQASPASVSEGGGYRYQGNPDWRPDDPRIGNESRSPGKASKASATAAKDAMHRRLAAYCAARDEGDTPRVAAEKAGITTPKTVRKYEAQWAAARTAKEPQP